jgi:hypothetical protein
MSETLIQAGIWVAAGGLMMLFLARRRSHRKER